MGFLTMAFIVSLIIVLAISCKKDNYTPNSKGNLYLLLEAPGFTVPELQTRKKIMDPSDCASKI